MKIAYVITRADAVGGASIHVRDMARAMLERGHQSIVLLGGIGPVSDQLAEAGIPFRALESLRRPVRPIRDWRALAEMTSVLRELCPDIVSAHTAKAGFIARAACARLGLPAVYTPHGWAMSERLSFPSTEAFTIAERLASKWARAIICVCEYERRLAFGKSVAANEKLFVVHNGVRDIPASFSAEPGRCQVRICSVARLESPKDHATLFRALAELRSQNWHLDLVGDGPLEPALRKLAADLGLAERIDFLGYQRDPAGILAQAQIFALSSRSEAFPRSILEAMRAGLPVVASDVGGVSEAMVHGVTGLLVPPGHSGALAGAIGKLIDISPYREQLGVAARRAFEAGFRAEPMFEKTEAIYAKVLQEAVTRDGPPAKKVTKARLLAGYTVPGGFGMGLAERRVIHEFETKELPALQSRVDEAAGYSVPVEAKWDKLAPEGESHLYVESWKAVYFEPLITALTAIATDDMAREALKNGLRNVVITNTRGYYYPDDWAKFEGGTLTLDHDPITNTGDVQPRAARLITVLESGL